MRLLIVALLPMACAAAEIPEGSHVLLRMVNSISTRTAQAGDAVYLRTASPIAVNGQILVPAESYVTGVVSYSKRSGKVRGRAELGIRLDTLTLPNGKAYKFSPRLASADPGEGGQKAGGRENEIKAAASTGEDAKRIAILAGSGAGIGGLADRGWKGAGIGAGVGSAAGAATTLLTRGHEVELRAGSTLDVVFDHPVEIQ
ncbi:MAG TPA: hypothetical protein VKV74_10175 [Bryobacteraceae bacterium]|nr:hypothetical protein [Bryobacteraceae bacterium]